MGEWRIIGGVAIIVGIALYAMMTPENWQKFLNSLDTGGGHIIVLFVLLLIGWRMFQMDPTAGGSIMTLASGALLGMMKPPDKKAEKAATLPDPVVDPLVDSTGGGGQ